jgi:hypothetical protein
VGGSLRMLLALSDLRDAPGIQRHRAGVLDVSAYVDAGRPLVGGQLVYLELGWTPVLLPAEPRPNRWSRCGWRSAGGWWRSPPLLARKGANRG